MMGPPGVGKTFICAALLGWSVEKFHTRRVWREAELFSKLRKSIDLGYDCYEILKECSDYQFLILDDFGANSPNSWREEMIFNFIDLRYNSRRPMVISTNLSRAEIRDRYHARIESRLFAKENVVIDFSGEEDLRERGL